MRAYLMLSVAILVPTMASASNSVCDSPTSSRDIEIQSKNFVLTQNSFGDVVDGKKVIFIGDEHFYTSIAAYKTLIDYFSVSRGKMACVAFEFAKTDVDANKALLTYFAQLDASVEQTRIELAKPGHLPAEIADAKDYIAEMEENRNQNAVYFIPMLQEVSARGMKAVAVDDPKKSHQELSVPERNLAIAKNINELLSSGACSSIMMIVGKQHLVGPLNLKFLAESPTVNVDSITINLQMTAETVPIAEKTWNRCEAPKLTRPVIFKSSVIFKDQSALIPVLDDSPRFIDFDYTILLP